MSDRPKPFGQQTTKDLLGMHVVRDLPPSRPENKCATVRGDAGVFASFGLDRGSGLLFCDVIGCRYEVTPDVDATGRRVCIEDLVGLPLTWVSEVEFLAEFGDYMAPEIN